MNKKIIGGILVLSLAVGSVFTVKAFATSNGSNPDITTNTQNSTDRSWGMGRMGGNSFMGGILRSIVNNLTEDQKTQLLDLKEEAQAAIGNVREEIQPLRDDFKAAVDSGDKDKILDAYEAMIAQKDTRIETMKPFIIKAGEILGKDLTNFNFENKNNPMQTLIDNLKNAKTDEEIKAAIAALDNTCGGIGSRGGFNQEDGFGMRGGMMNGGRGGMMNGGRGGMMNGFFNTPDSEFDN